MPKRQNEMTASEQSQRFINDVQSMIDDGELNPTEADAAIDRLITTSVKTAKKAPTTTSDDH